MYFDRKALKQRTKKMYLQGQPAAWKVTLVFFLATTWVSAVVGYLIPDPISSAMGVLAYGEMDLYSSGAYDALMQQILSCFQGTGAMIGLLVVLLIGFYSMVVDLGYCAFALRSMRGQQAGYRELFSNFYMAGKIILLQVLKLVFIYLWSLLFIIPGIVAGYRYRMAEYALLDDPDISALEAIRRSKRLTRGHKGELFALDLSFLGWIVLQALVSQCIYSVLASVTGAYVMADLVALAAETAISLFLYTYQMMSVAGFYCFLLNCQAPPVNEGQWRGSDDGRGRWDRFDSNGSSGGDEGWNR